MEKLITVTLILVMVFGLMSFRVLANNGELTAEQSLKMLQSVNKNIASYDIKTHLVTYKDGSKPVYVTPPGEHPQNGEVTWAYFIEQKGDLRGWLKLPLKEIIREKARIVREFKKLHGIDYEAKSSSGYDFPDSYYVSCTQFPQQCNNWCGPAATQSVLSGWGITGLQQSDIAQRENVPCNVNYGTSENAIASTLNYYIQENWYDVNHWGIVLADIGYWETHEAFVGECDTIYLTDWRNNVSDGKTKNRVHYIAVRGYWTPTDNTPPDSDWQEADIYYTDSATSIHPGLHRYVSEKFYGGITYSSIPSDYTKNNQGITSFYNANLRWPVIG